ncbi:hypothetical protein [Paraburkholderia unamae]|uniref:hypothetical protein n=1 Tax=Paraburkholderia unamae TaxID=219649 RepID=UPI001CC56465|nr:hypothetical protein [Paraburkholderia unamae]
MITDSHKRSFFPSFCGVYTTRSLVHTRLLFASDSLFAATVRVVMNLDACNREIEDWGGSSMLHWLSNLIAHNAATPEKQAQRALGELRMALFQAEQRVLDAQLQAEYYRMRIAFCEEVLKTGIEQVSDHRKGQLEAVTHDLRPNLKLTTSQ